MFLRQAVATRLRELLELNKLTQYQLSKRSGIAESTISTILSERYRTCEVETIGALALGMNMSLTEFFDDKVFNKEFLEYEIHD